MRSALGRRAARWVSYAGLGLLLLAIDAPRASAHPLGRVSAWLAKGAKVAHQSDHTIRIAAEGIGRELVIGDHPGPGIDIWFQTVERRGRNPYRAWYVDRALLKSPKLPKAQWPRFLKVNFLRVLVVGDKPAP